MSQKPDGKNKLIADLTGVNASKLSYYAELKKRQEKIRRQNVRLEILHRLTRALHLEMSVEDMFNEAQQLLPEALPCDLLGLAMLQNDELVIKALPPFHFRQAQPLPRDSVLWEPLNLNEALILGELPKSDPFFAGYPHLAEQLHSLVVAPLHYKSANQGLLLIGSSQKSAYTQEELSFVQHLAEQLAISIQNAQLYEEVSRARQGWEATFNAVTEPILLIDTEYNIQLNNHRPLPELFPDGKPSQQDQKCFTTLYGRNSPCPNCPMQTLAIDPRPIYRHLETKTGRQLDLSFYPVLGKEQELVAMTIIIKDITEKAQMEAKLMHSARLAAIGEMAAGVAHELNSPMTVVIGTAQLLYAELAGNPEQGDSLKEIADCGLRCKRIIQNLLTFSRQEQVPMDLTNLNREIERALGLVNYLVDPTQITIVKQLAEDLPRIMANAVQIQQVVTNLLINARDALTDKTGEKTIYLKSYLEQGPDQDWVTVSVRDNGTGIEKDKLDDVFTPFYTSKEATKGTGLGLSVSFGIAQAHGGTLEVESSPGKGSCFSLKLPPSPPQPTKHLPV
ncbi:histidine kinase [Syntrophotalea acetylenivorans]|uniref:histidine kinase n=1 Tax=Syntrophotalea acetylenivorans TaxID=1842532 RepID=A0A1L3GQU9_9BACT|nr:sensor histidine kinase [Syntrophotalea acetylenivorans]APG28294.1 histidine kinase [Syntrophotalea acetylenivorans]